MSVASYFFDFSVSTIIINSRPWINHLIVHIAVKTLDRMVLEAHGLELKNLGITTRYFFNNSFPYSLQE